MKGTQTKILRIPCDLCPGVDIGHLVVYVVRLRVNINDNILVINLAKREKT